MEKKILVTYFSCSGVTLKVAQAIAALTEADLYEIEPKVPYTKKDLNWMDKKARSTIEMKDPSFRPEILSKLSNMDDYDVVFVGFPIWWYVAPTIINTFLESYDFSGKIIVPFATSGGSDLGKTEDKLKVSCPLSTVWKQAKLLNGIMKEETLSAWIESLGL